jgi:hypothetical protein
LALALVVPAWSADESFVGKWKAEFDSRVGKQKYTFEFKLEDGKLTGKAIGERQLGTNEAKLVELKTDKDEISFVEPLKLKGYDSELRVEYKGKLKDDEIKLHRKVADNNQYDIVAKRVKETDAKAETKTAPKKPETKTETVPPAKP